MELHSQCQPRLNRVLPGDWGQLFPLAWGMTTPGPSYEKVTASGFSGPLLDAGLRPPTCLTQFRGVIFALSAPKAKVEEGNILCHTFYLADPHLIIPNSERAGPRQHGVFLKESCIRLLLLGTFSFTAAPKLMEYLKISGILDLVKFRSCGTPGRSN